MFVTVESFEQDFVKETASTRKLLDALTDASLGQQVGPGYRTIGQLAWHLVVGYDNLAQLDLQFDYIDASVPPPSSAAYIAEAYGRTTRAALEAVKRQWRDEELQVVKEIWGMQWKKGYTLFNFIKHEVHHRGQLTVLMRQAGVPVTGVYGPSKEEWAYAGMEAPAY